MSNTLTCPNCQTQVEPVDGGFTPHFDRSTPLPDNATADQVASKYSCTKDPRVIDSLSGELEPEPDAPTPIQVPQRTFGEGFVLGAVTVAPG